MGALRLLRALEAFTRMIAPESKPCTMSGNAMHTLPRRNMYTLDIIEYIRSTSLVNLVRETSSLAVYKDVLGTVAH